MSHNITIKKGALFIADSHYNENRQDLLFFLEDLKKTINPPSQIFLMGDIFDFVCAEVDWFVEKSQKLIDAINDLSTHFEIYYLEGNHDYNLQSLFPKIKVFQRESQPILANYQDKKVALSHGDIFTPFGYNLYTKIIRNHFLLNVLNKINFDGKISAKIYDWLLSKNICSTMQEFDKFAKSRIDKYKFLDVDLIIEGHFHQGKSMKDGDVEYINIPSMACSLSNKVYYLN